MVWRAGKQNALPETTEADEDLVVASLDEIDVMAKAMSGVDVVFHLAGKTNGYRREEFDAVNVDGMKNLFAAVAKADPAPKRVVTVSSIMGAGPSDGTTPICESHVIEPGPTMYGESKLAGERVAFEAAREMDVEVLIVRPAMVYGPGEYDVLQLLRSVKFGIIAQPGRHTAPFSTIYVKDLADALLIVGERGTPISKSGPHVLAGEGTERPAPPEDPTDVRGQGIYYVTDGERHTFIELGRQCADAMGKRALAIRFPSFMVMMMAACFELIGRIIGRMPTLTIDKARGGLVSWWCDDRRLRKDVEFQPRYTLAEGMRETVAWYRKTGAL